MKVPILLLVSTIISSSAFSQTSKHLDTFGIFDISKKGEITLNLQKPSGTYTPGTNPMTYTNKAENLYESIFVEKTRPGYVSRASYYKKDSEGEEIETNSLDAKGKIVSAILCANNSETKKIYKKFACYIVNQKFCNFVKETSDKLEQLDEEEPKYKNLKMEIKNNFHITHKKMTNEDFLKDKLAVSKTGIYKKDFVAENAFSDKKNNEDNFSTASILCGKLNEQAEEESSGPASNTKAPIPQKANGQ